MFFRLSRTKSLRNTRRLRKTSARLVFPPTWSPAFSYLPHWKKNWVILTLKVESLLELKFDPGLREIREYLSQIDWILRVELSSLTLNTVPIWLSTSCQFDSQHRVNLTLNIVSIWLSISCQFDSQHRVNLTLNIVSIWLSTSCQFDSQHRVNLTLNIESIWLSTSSQFDSQHRVNLTLNIESIWLSISSQYDSQYRVNLTLNIESIWLSISSQFDSNILQLLGISGRILVPPVTQFFRSKWLNFFFQCW